MSYFAEYAWLPGGLARHVTIEIAESHFSRVESDTVASADATSLAGLVLPGFANVHSHAFHRALRGAPSPGAARFGHGARRCTRCRAPRPRQLPRSGACHVRRDGPGGGDGRRRVPLLHHARGRPYADPNAMGAALVEAARQAGVRLTLLDTCYLAVASAGWSRAAQQDPAAVQRRRRRALGEAGGRHRGRPAPHRWRRRPLGARRARRASPPSSRRPPGAPARAPLRAAGRERGVPRRLRPHPSALLDAEGVLGPATTAVHATHLRTEDVDLLGRSGPGSASARRPSAISPTGSARREPCATPARPSASARTSTQSSTSSRRHVPSRWTTAWRAASGDGSRRVSCSPH